MFALPLMQAEPDDTPFEDKVPALTVSPLGSYSQPSHPDTFALWDCSYTQQLITQHLDAVSINRGHAAVQQITANHI